MGERRIEKDIESQLPVNASERLNAIFLAIQAGYIREWFRPAGTG